jgi:spermidine synthase
LACGLFFLSGLTSLVYEVIWVRLLTLTFGVSAFAVATVLLAYMGGLCTGSYWFGRRADQERDQLRLYGLLEGLVGLYALIMPLVLDGAGSLYVLVHRTFEPDFYVMSLIRLACSIAILAVPTFLMGGTMPLLAAALAEGSPSVARRVSALYALNTLGATVGCLLAGYVLIPRLGLTGTTIVASAGNAAICAVAWLHRSQKSQAPVGSPERAPVIAAAPARPGATPPAPPWLASTVLACFALSGLCAMAYQTIWTRLLSMVIGTTVYAFTSLLAVFLAGLVIGSALYRGWLARRALAVFALGQLGVGLFVLGTMPYFDQLPFTFLKLFAATKSNWYLFQAARLGLVLAILIGPTAFFGLSLPLVVEICGARRERAGHTVGSIYAVNTVGAIVGSFIGGFVLIPFLGLQQGLLILALINVACGVLLVLLDPAPTVRRRAVLVTAGAGLAVLFAALLRPWNLHYLNSGPYVYAHEYLNAGGDAELKQILDSYQLRFFREDASATVSVFDIGGTLSLAIDGKTDASTGGNADMSTQVLLAHLPAMLTKHPGNALLVGLGSGVSLGSLLKYPRVESVDVLELSEGVVEASNLFRAFNGDALDDPRTHLIVGDGRHHLMRTKKVYDLVVSQPSNPWISGVSNLFTKEYYQLIHDRLAPAGVVCQWIPTYFMSREMLAVVLKSFTNVFPHASLWTSSVPGDLFVIGSKAPLAIDYALLEERLARPGIQKDLARIGMGDPTLLAKTFKFGDTQIQDFVRRFADELPENTDLNPVIEFMTPQFLLTRRVAKEFGTRGELKGELATLLGYIAFDGDETRRRFEAAAQGVLRN